MGFGECIFRHFIFDSDSSLVQRRKKISFMIFSAAILVTSPSLMREPIQYAIVCLLGNLVSAVSLIKLVVTKKISELDIIIFLTFWLFAVIFLDMISFNQMDDSIWPSVVVLIDLALLCSLPNHVALSMVVITALFLSIMGLERVIRVGLFDFAGGERMHRLRSCFPGMPEDQISSTPCKNEFFYAGTITSVYICVFLLDYFCTRSFAYGMKLQQEKLESSLSLAETVVAALVRFDLDEAEAQINNNEKTELSSVLRNMIHNLHQYRPYLPDSLFEFNDSEDNATVYSRRPPTGNATIVFTDLKSSTAFWEESPDAMKQALKIHDSIIRRCISEFNGYEVKTIGDSFMVAFDKMDDGCSFAMSVQERFHSTQWPSDLILPSIFEASGWDGLMVRIGICSGEVQAEVNPVSGRTDYFGRTVNRAARLEGVCVPGAVAVETDQLCDIDIPDTWNERSISEQLKGLGDNPIPITILSMVSTGSTISESYGKNSWVGNAMDSLSRCSVVTLTPTAAAKTHKLVQKSSATVCEVQVPDSNVDQFDFGSQINTGISKAITCMDRTEGSIVSVVASTITMGWNTSRVTATHFQNALRFISLLHRSFSDGREVHVGISSSPVCCGTVGTKDQRFVTVFGDCMKMSRLLCQASCDIGCVSLCANSPIDFPLLRPVDSWVVTTGPDIIIFEVCVDKLKEWLKFKVGNEGNGVDSVDWGWSDEYREAFTRKDCDMIEENKHCDDHVLGRVAEFLASGKSLRPVFEIQQTFPKAT
eukprot:TRINITY_DN5145_c0_g1_i1.p1 TRINITY_DN5145_c0_g1~~TRINITY_DN5145_c0_g1_i1.p1  ORF type:complete len:763 (+),score=97.72 TRINITY_DN5145_c0_g1_i1:53-2341(+)